MKERTKGFIAGFLLCALLIGLGIPVGAATYKKAVEVYYRDIKVTVDSQEVTPKDAQGNKVEPFIMNGTTYLPVRGICFGNGRSVGQRNQHRQLVHQRKRSCGRGFHGGQNRHGKGLEI